MNVTEKIKHRVAFPLEVLPSEIAESIQDLSIQTNIPLDFLACSAIAAIAALSGNIYKGNLNGGCKPIVYLVQIGPSGVGKTPAFRKTCGDIIDPLRAQLDATFKIEYGAWKDRQKLARELKQQFNEKPPSKRVRFMEDATEEAISKHAETSPAGFGLYYDEGGRFFGSASQYKKDNSTVNFWNELWNGKAYEIHRVDVEKDRFIKNPAISVIIGLQKDRLAKYFTEDVIQSGLPFRFLMCQGEFKPMNEFVDYFENKKQEMCETWQVLIRSLFLKGASLPEDSEPILVEFNQNARIKYNEVMSEVTQAQNQLIKSIKKEDENTPIIGAGSKLAAYIPRLALILAIIDDHTGPNIDTHHVEGAYKLYKFFKRTSDKVLLSLNATAKTGLTENELDLLENLPESQFTAKQAEDTCSALGLGKGFFKTSLTRKYKMGWVKTISKGLYEKI